MQIGDGRIVRDHSEQRARRIHESENGHDRVDDTKDLKPEPRSSRARHCREEEDDPRHDMHEIVRGVDMEDAKQHRHTIHVARHSGNEAENSNRQEDDTKSIPSVLAVVNLLLV